jgi:TonB-dependent receptor-like protein
LKIHWFSFIFLISPLMAQKGSGELRLFIADGTGLPLEARCEASSQATQARQALISDFSGRCVFKGLPFGPYRLSVMRAGFQPWSELAEVRSEVPVSYKITLGVATVETAVVITESATLLDPYRTASVNYVGRETLDSRRSVDASRAVLDQVQAQPGWLLEANGVLHPRGAEYGTQYVIDGIPIQDNRSPGFAPALEAEDLESMNVFTAGYPAEYGRKLGGVIETSTPRDARPGVHGKVSVQGGSFAALHGYASAQVSSGRTTISAAGQGFQTERFLDPPVERNFTNNASSGGGQARFEQDLTDRDRIRVSFYNREVRFLAPNELEQQMAGQRQDRTSGESMGQAAYQRVITPRLLLSARAMVRDLTARLWSNAASTPIGAAQDRGFREGYGGASVSYHRGIHELKAGFEVIQSSLRESFSYRITRNRFFSGEIPRNFSFADEATGSEQAGFVQDLVRLGHWTFSAGLRWDRYRLKVSDSAFSPRLGAAYFWEPAGIVLRASYDRAFQTPASENLLLASSAGAQHLTATTTGLPVPASRGDFYQAGFSKSLGGKLRLDGNWFSRRIRNFADDDVFLNTGISFPIAFSSARISGYEAKLEMPRWGPVSGYVSWANLIGRGQLPITGGLFLDAGAKELLSSTEQFAITQDQRNTVSARVRVRALPRTAVAVGTWYGSGLPVERVDDDLDDLEAAYGPRVLDRVNFARGRVRPSHSIDLSASFEAVRRDSLRMTLYADVLNVTNRLNVINFAGLFSGTALGAPRTFGARMQVEF